MGIIIDKEFQALIPPLSDDEYRQLEENCIRDGIRDPLVTWPQDDGNQILIDGHNRWEISAKNAGIPFKIVHMRFESRDAAKAWIIKNQLGRRNLPIYERGRLALQLKPIIEADAKKRMANAPQKKVEREKALEKKINDIKAAGHSYDVTQGLIQMARQASAREQRAENLREEKQIYFAKLGGNRVKVGSSVYPDVRIKQLSVTCPGIRLYACIHFGEGAEAMENKIKKKFSAYRIGNECYQCADSVIDEMIAYVKKVQGREKETDWQLAKAAGVSHDTIHKVEVIEKNAPAEIKEKARRGEISTNEAYRQTTNIMRPLRKTDIAKEAEEQHAEYQQKKDSGIVSVTDAAVDKENRRILALELSKRVTRAINAAQDISLLKGDQKSIIAELTPEEQGDIRMQLEKLISMLVALNAQIGGANGQI